VNTSSYGPVVSGALLTHALKRRRQTAGLQQEQAARSLEWPVSKLIRIENGNILVSESDLEALLRCYGVTDQGQVDELSAWARDASIPGWWDRFGIQDKAFERYIGYEHGATSVRMAQGMLIPGILQTEEYARLMTGGYAEPEEIDTIVLLRMRRQREVFARAPQQSHILDEAILRRPAGDVMPGQIQRLAELARQPEITIRIIPFEAGPHSGLRGPFVLLGFDVPLGGILYLESPRTLRENLVITEEIMIPGRSISIDDTAEAIAIYESRFEALKLMALDPAESIRLLDQIASEIG
jgi:transcriptional regulator with XRE-family HTH domain